MKKRLTALLLSLLACSAWAESIDQEGRKWITASDLSNDNHQSVSVRKPISNAHHIFKQFIIQDNNINKCLFPEIYHSNDRGEAVVEQWWNDTENGGRLKRSHYLKLKMRLAQKIMPSQLADDFLSDRMSGELQQKYEQIEQKYRRTISIKSQKECEKIGKYATDLVEQYDETNQRWRKSFPNP